MVKVIVISRGVRPRLPAGATDCPAGMLITIIIPYFWLDEAVPMPHKGEILIYSSFEMLYQTRLSINGRPKISSNILGKSPPHFETLPLRANERSTASQCKGVALLLRSRNVVQFAMFLRTQGFLCFESDSRREWHVGTEESPGLLGLSRRSLNALIAAIFSRNPGQAVHCLL